MPSTSYPHALGDGTVSKNGGHHGGLSVFSRGDLKTGPRGQTLTLGTLGQGPRPHCCASPGPTPRVSSVCICPLVPLRRMTSAFAISLGHQNGAAAVQ